MAPLVSVIIPTHNRKALLLQAVRSVRHQRDAVLEILVVDDGSADGTAHMISSLNDPRILLLRSEFPRGVCAARNEGIFEANGEWVALLDDDDLWAPDKLARQVTAARGAGRAWAYGGAVEIDEHGAVRGGAEPPSPETMLRELRTRNLMPAGSSNVIVRAGLLRELGAFDPGLRHLGDWDLWLRLADAGAPACVSAPLVAYRIHPGQATLDSTGMIHEASVLRARYGADPTSIFRWVAWSELRRGRKGRALRAYALAVRAGNLTSAARAAVAVLHPRPTSLREPSAKASAWKTEAQAWLRELVAT